MKLWPRRSRSQSVTTPSTVAAERPRPKRRQRLCILSPSRSVIYSLELVAKVHCVPRTVYESAELIEILGADRVLEDCALLIVDLQGAQRDRNRTFLRKLVHRPQGLEGLKVVVLTTGALGYSYPGVQEVRLTTRSHQLNVAAFEQILAPLRHPEARSEIIPAYRLLLQQAAEEEEVEITGRHHFGRKLALLDADPLFDEAVKHVCLRLGLTLQCFASPRDLLQAILHEGATSSRSSIRRTGIPRPATWIHR